MTTLTKAHMPIDAMLIEQSPSTLWVGIDVGSTTVKTVAVDPFTHRIVSWNYERHDACQMQTVERMLGDLHDRHGDADMHIGICGSGAKPIGDLLGGLYVQEVIATSIAIQELHPKMRTVIELGGQDSKIMVFDKDARSEKSNLIDMRMNGVCAGGTGAFIDQMAALLGINTEDFCDLASNGKMVHQISGRCGVFAKSDILPLLNIGISKADIALSVCSALVNQTMCSLAQGLEILPPVGFLGGPLTFNPVLVKAYMNRLGITYEDAIVPDYSQVMAAIGAAMYIGHADLELKKVKVSPKKRKSLLTTKSNSSETGNLFFTTSDDYAAFMSRHELKVFEPVIQEQNGILNVFAGIDAGSTTLKVVLIDSEGQVVNKWYGNASGDTIGTAKKALLDMQMFYADFGVKLNIIGLGTTGYGEAMCARVLGADFHTVETFAHASGTMSMYPDVSFILDIGGQDMKAMKIDREVILDVYMNDACSSGCGSFIETTANNLGIATSKIADRAFKSQNPVSLGSRCTVFMLSSITTEQKNGKSVDDLIGGLCRSIVDNVFEKLLRVANLDLLGEKVVVQGGTFKNDAILRAFEQYIGREVFRPAHCGEMGAYGIALLTRDKMQAADGDIKTTKFIGFDTLVKIGNQKTSTKVCSGCANSCNRAVIDFGNNITFCTGHRCPKGDMSSNGSSQSNKNNKNHVTRVHTENALSCFKEQLLLSNNEKSARILPSNNTTIGIPLVFEFWNSLPFWTTLFHSLGFDVSVSGKSSSDIAERGSKYAASDSICLPAKLMHGHIETLLDKEIDKIFVPALRTAAADYTTDTAIHMCPIVQGLPIMVKHLNQPDERKHIGIDAPVFAFHTQKLRDKQIIAYLKSSWGISGKYAKQAIKRADAALSSFKDRLKQKFDQMLLEIEESDSFGVLLCMRPYHADSYVNHKIPELFGSYGIVTLTSDILPYHPELETKFLRPEKYNPFHTELYSAALYAAQHPKLEVAQLVSFGCGHDAVTSDEIRRIMASTGGKRPLVLKIDDGECDSALTIRIRSFIETVKSKRARN